MRLTLLIAFAILMSGCETTPPAYVYEFATFEKIEEDATYPSELPILAPFECGEDPACPVAGYTRATDIDTLERFKELAKGNTEIAETNADIINTLLEREEAILAAAKAQEQIANIREEQLQWERQEATRQKWYYRAMIVLVGAAGVYASQ